MLILIDGYNVIAPVAPPGKNPASDWLHQERMMLIDRLANQLDPQLASQTCVVFDATTRSRSALGNDANSDSTLRLRQIEVRFAVNHDEADDLIEELIALHSSPKRLTVVSSDHRLQAAAKRCGATVFDSQPWLDSLLDGHLLLAIAWPPERRDGIRPADAHGLAGDEEKSESLDDTTVQQWMRAFGVTDNKRQHASRPPKQRHKPAQSQATEPQSADSNVPKAKPRVQKPHSQPRPNQKTPADPKRNIESDNPFPDGYGEDLL
jgi:predicted RNA-binding protein with PIN domain